MKYYFEDEDKQKDLGRILESWRVPHTPYRHHCGVKGLGCDCLHFVGRVLEEIGLLKWRKGLFPDYPQDWHLHNTRELLSENIERELKVEKIYPGNLMDGDIILHHYGKAASHAGIFFGGFVYHAISGAGVIRTSFEDQTFRKRMQFAYRVLA